MSSESIFSRYPQDIVQVEGPVEGTTAHRLTTVTAKVFEFFATENVPDFELPHNYRDPEYQISEQANEDRGRLDAVVGRRINRIGHGIGMIGLAFSPEIITRDIDNALVNNPALIFAGLVLGMSGVFRAASAGRLDEIYQIHQMQSNVRRPDNFLRLLVSKKWYEGARNRQEGKRANKLLKKIKAQTVSE